MSKDEIPKRINILVSGETWCRLSGEKYPGESFDKVIGRLLDFKAQGAN